MSSVRFLWLLAGSLALGCAPGDAGREAIDTTQASPAETTNVDTARSAADTSIDEASPLAFPPDSGSVGITRRPRAGIAPVVLRAVRAATHDDFDRVVFEFEGAVVPGYHVEYVDRPIRQCGSGEPVQVAGDGWLAVRLEPAQAHAGDTTVVATVRDRNRVLELPNLRQLVLICDFEAQVEWVLGLRSPNRYRVRELTGPARLVIDVRN